MVWPGGVGRGMALTTTSSSGNFAVAFDNLGNLFTNAPNGQVSVFLLNQTFYIQPAALRSSAQAVSLWFSPGVGLYAANGDGSIFLWPLTAPNSGTVDPTTQPITVAAAGACNAAQGLQVMPLTNKVYCAAMGSNAVQAFVPFNKCA
jgi:hypothetical protein